MKALFLILLTAISACAQLTWRSDSFFKTSPPPYNTPTGTGPPAFYPSASGISPRVAFANGAWYLCDGNFIKPLIFDHGTEDFQDTVAHSGQDGSHFYTQPIQSPGLEWVTALAAGDDRIMGVGNLEYAGMIGNWEENEWSYDSEKITADTKDISGLVFSPWLNVWVACADKIFTRLAGNGNSWNLRRSDTGNRWTAVAAGEIGLVAVSHDGKFTFSATGSNWETGTINSSIFFTDVTYGDGLFVALGDDRIYSSSDGINWTQRHTHTNADFQAVAYGNRTWVAIPKSGNRIHYSTNGGTQWNNHTNIQATELRDLAYGDGVFVAIGPGGKIRWSDIDLSISDSINSVLSSGLTTTFSVQSDWSSTPWRASTTADWIDLTIDGDPAGHGSSSFSYLIQENTGTDRRACISVNGKTMQIHQNGPLGSTDDEFEEVALDQLKGALFLTWNDAADETGYRIERAAAGASWQTVEANLPANSFHYSDKSGTDGISYRYRVTPLGLNTTSSITEWLEVSSANDIPSVRAFPLRDNRMLVVWEDRSPNYLLKRTANGSTTDLLPVVSGSDPTGYRMNTHVDHLPSNLHGGNREITYTASFNNGTASNFGVLGSVTTQTIPEDFPAGVSHPIDDFLNKLQWEPVVISNGNWQHRFTYKVEGRKNGGSLTHLATVDASSFVHSINIGDEWIYRITPQNPSGEAPSTVLYSFDLCPKIPARVISFARGNPSQTSISLSWEFSDNNSEKYQLERRVNGGSWSLVNESDDPVRTGSGLITDLIAGHEYEFRLRSVWNGAASDWFLLPAFRTDMGDPARPFVNESQANRLRINWATLSGADRYEVRRSLNGITGWTVVTPAGGVENREFNDTSVTPLVEYFYQVRGVHDLDISAWSPSESGIAPQALGVLSNFHDLRCFEFFPSGTPTRIVLERAVNGTNFSSKINIADFALDPRSNSWIARDLEVFFPTRVFYYRVLVEEGRLKSYSEIRGIWPVSFPPTNLIIQPQANGVNVEWIPSLSGSTYDVERRELGGGSSYEVLISDWSQSAFLDQTAQSGIVYEYRVLSRGDAPYDGPSRYLGPGEGARLESIRDWRYDHFGIVDNTGQAANSADPDKDGLSNLAELMFGLDPTESSHPHPFKVIEHGPTKVQFRYTLRENYEFWPVKVMLEMSQTLDSWPTKITLTHPVAGTVSEFRHTIPASNSSTFFRLSFEEE